MRWVFLAAGFGAGLAVGFFFSLRETPRAVRRRAPAIEREARALTAEEDTAPGDETRPSARGPASPVVGPTGDLSEQELESLAGRGRIEVDFEGFDGDHRARVAYTTLTGSREEDDACPDHDQTVAPFDLVPGVYDVWWLSGPRRVGTRVRVVAGRVVRIRAADFDTAPIPRDLAVLGISVAASWGGSLPFFRVEIEAVDNRLNLRTNSHGCVSATLRPGEVTVKVGDQVTPVAVVAGRETVLEVRHRAEGDLLFDQLHGGGPARIGLRPAGGGRAVARARYNVLGRDGFPYVKAGDYEVYRKHGRGSGGGTLLGTVRIFAGRASRFRLQLPPGVLAIRVELPEEHARKAAYVLVSLQSVVRHRPVGATAGQVGYGVAFSDQVHGVRATSKGRHFYHARIDGLHPGKYRVICGTATETVEVGAGVTQVVLRPPR